MTPREYLNGASEYDGLPGTFSDDPAQIEAIRAYRAEACRRADRWRLFLSALGWALVGALGMAAILFLFSLGGPR